MPRGSEPAPRAYARLVAANMKAIANDRGTTNRALAKQMLVSEGYLRVRFADDPKSSFTVSDVERFALVYRFDAAWFLADPERARAELKEEVLTNVVRSIEDAREKRNRPDLAVAAEERGDRTPGEFGDDSGDAGPEL